MVALSRRQVLALGGAAVVIPSPRRPVTRDIVADVYRRVLHLHTRWMEQQWDPAIGAYRAADFRFAGVLGNAVLLRMADYDPKLAGVDKRTLGKRTVATIERFARTNRLAGGVEWGRQLPRDAAVELYFVLAARLLWADLDSRTRAKVAQIAIGQATYTYGLAYGTRGGDTGLTEMGVHAQAVAPGLAWGRDDAALRERFLFWAANAGAHPAADRANLTRQDGTLVKDRSRAATITDTFIVTGEDGVDPHRQADLWRTAGRAAIHFMTAGKPVPEVLRNPPNGEQLWRTLRLLASDAGQPVLPMTADHYHQYGRDVLPLAYLAQVTGDRHAARAEADLADRLEPYLRCAPEWRLAKFGGDEAAEAEARADLAIAYLFHRHRKSPTPPATDFFARARGTRDFGVGLTAHQTEDGFAAAVTKTGFVNFLWQPRHDHWFIDTRAAAFLPPSVRNPSATWTAAYSQVRDGVEATATVLTFGEQYAGYATLPTGSVVYASTGVGTDEGAIPLFNRRVPGVPGLTGHRRFAGAAGSITLSGEAGGGGDGGVDELHFPARPVRYVRVRGRHTASQFGYSLWTVSVLDEAGADLAQGALAAASSSDVTYPAYNATDGNPETRWAVDRTQLSEQDGWYAVDLGSTVTVAGVRLTWESAYATDYVIQTSLDASVWSDVVTVPQGHRIDGNWVDIDGRAALITFGSDRPITVSATGVIAATGPAAPALIEGYARTGLDLETLSRRRLPRTPPGLWVSDADGYLSVFNLSDRAVSGAIVVLPSRQRLYRGAQVVRKDGLGWNVTQPAGTGRVEPPRFEVAGEAPLGTRFTVTDSHRVTVTAPASRPVAIALRSGSWSSPVRVPAGKSTTVAVPGGPVTPAADLARGRTTFPTSPLPTGMSSPSRAVDGNPATSWRPGPTGRMVVDLGTTRSLSLVRLIWTPGHRRPVRVERSTDGVTYSAIGRSARPTRLTDLPVKASARYVGVVVDGWQPGDAKLVEVSAF